jgi:hypothetical protein
MTVSLRIAAGIVVFGLLIVAGAGWIFGEIQAENEARAWASAYGAPLDHLLADYAQANPGSAAARQGFFGTELPRRPCQQSPDQFAEKRRFGGLSGCTAISVGAHPVHPWVRVFVPHRVLIRVATPVWTDPVARAQILRLIASRRALCAAASRETSETVQREARHILACDGTRAPRHQVSVVADDYPFAACQSGRTSPRVTYVRCQPRPAFDPHAIEIRPID